MSAVRRDDRSRVFYEGTPLNAASAIALGCLLLVFGGVVMGAGVTWWSVRKAVDRAVDVRSSSSYSEEVASLAEDEESRKKPKPAPKPKDPPPKPDPEEPKRPDPAVKARANRADRLTGDPPLWIEPAKPGRYGPSPYER